jgi:hypothetical protein
MASGGLRIDARFHGGADFSGAGNGDDENLGDVMNRYLRVKASPTACAPCKANAEANNVHNVPCWECTGNIDRIDPDEGIGNLCKCTVVVVTEEEHDHI